MNYNNIYTRGYVISSKSLNDDKLKNWHTYLFNGVYFYFEEHTNFTFISYPNSSKIIVLIGCPISMDPNIKNERQIAHNIYKTWNSSGNFKDALREIAYLGGRFIACLICKTDIKKIQKPTLSTEEENGIILIPDCSASYACYYAKSDSLFCASSHSGLLAKICNLNVSEQTANIFNHPDYQEPGGKYYPALLTPFENINMVFPNCYLYFCFKNKSIKHLRFYPFVDRVEKDIESAYKEFTNNFLLHINAIVGNKEFYLSLTAGLDSNVALKAIVLLSKIKFCRAFTYYRPNVDISYNHDLFEASSICAKYNILHKTILLRPMDFNCDFHKMYAKTFKYGARFPALSRAYYEELPHNIINLTSTFSETGRCFYKQRDIKTISSDILCKKFSTSKINQNILLKSCFDAYIKHVEFYDEKMKGYDFYDMFYWEHRMAKWASLWYSEADLSNFTVTPFNQRDIIESMLSVDMESRKNSVLLKRFIANGL